MTVSKPGLAESPPRDQATEAQSSRSYPLNCWYVAAWASEVSKQPLRRKLLGEAVVLYRSESGDAVALRDRCPHRFAPLSRGKVSGDNINCGYHGLAFNREGVCVKSAFSEKVPRLSVRAFPVVERDNIIWIWPGDQPADPSRVPDFAFQVPSAERRILTGYTVMKANYLLGSDNLMDLSHIEFVHTGTFAGDGVIFRGEHKITAEGDSLKSDWFMPAIEPPQWAKSRYPDCPTIVDHWLDMHWTAPACMRLDVGIAPAGQGRSEGFVSSQAHILTPETESTTHYFWSASRTHDLDSAEVDAKILDSLRAAFDAEDKPMIEAVQEEMGSESFWALKPYALGIDAGGVRVRRKVEALIANELRSEANFATP
jgi:phenylpropionate dioxygenase-like ring-hydroxylating dioxygenase large terminal subunit